MSTSRIISFPFFLYFSSGWQRDKVLPVPPGLPGPQDFDPLGPAVCRRRRCPLLPPSLREAEPHVHGPLQGQVHLGDRLPQVHH